MAAPTATASPVRRERAGAPRTAAGAGRAPGEPRRVAYLYLAPAFVFYLLFAFGPLIYTTWLSFFDWDGLTVGTWVGLDNYKKVLQRPGHPRVVRPLVRADLLLRDPAGRRSGWCSRR